MWKWPFQVILSTNSNCFLNTYHFIRLIGAFGKEHILNPTYHMCKQW